MTMPFLVEPAALSQPGDRVTFGLREVPDALLVVMLERLAPGR
jgi:hypothetical protein